MSHPADSESSHSDGTIIEIVPGLEAVRVRPMMYISSTDHRGLHELLQLTVEGLLWHYRFLEHVPSQITVQLEGDGSAIITSAGGTMPADILKQSAQLLGRELVTLWCGRPCFFSIVNALSCSLCVTICEPENHWRSLLFEQGALRCDEESANPLDEGCDIQFCIRPDFTILEPGTFDFQYTLELMRSLLNSDHAVPITVLDARSHRV